MCGRLLLIKAYNEAAAEFGLERITAINYPERWNGAPSEDFPILRWNPTTRARCLDMMRWGLIPQWAKDEKIAFSTFNAKCETLMTKPAFRDAWHGGRRGILAADGFYEWKKLAAKSKQPYRITRADEKLMAIAVLWESRRLAGGEILRTFTIITTEANDKMEPLHHRMPVILSMDDVPRWLGEAPASEDELTALMRPCPPEWLTLVPVDPRMSNVRNQGAVYCQPIAVS